MNIKNRIRARRKWRITAIISSFPPSNFELENLFCWIKSKSWTNDDEIVWISSIQHDSTLRLVGCWWRGGDRQYRDCLEETKFKFTDFCALLPSVFFIHLAFSLSPSYEFCRDKAKIDTAQIKLDLNDWEHKICM